MAFRYTRENRFVLYSFLFMLASLLIARVLFFVSYSPATSSTSDILYAFYIGAKFDARIALLTHIPLAILFFFSATSLVHKRIPNLITRAYLILAGVIYIIIALVDLNFYSYQSERFSAVVLTFTDDVETSLGMAYETYPVFKYLAVTIIFAYIYHLFLQKLTRRMQHIPFQDYNTRAGRISRRVSFTLIVIFILYGNLEHYPLRWSNAFFSSDKEISNLAFNPVHYFFDTLKNSSNRYDLQKVKAYYPTVSNYLGLDSQNPDELNFKRVIKESKDHKPYNVVVIMMESFSSYKTGVGGNKLQPSASPNIDYLANNGLFFSNHFVPVAGTSFSLWSMLTGIPDFNPSSSASRNPFIVDQQTIANEFKDYEKSFFYSDNANWGNVRGFLNENLKDLRIYEENDFTGKRLSTWGVTDVRVFEKANQVYRDSTKPFLSIVLTSGNHRPFTIPDETDVEESAHFKHRSLPEGKEAEYGFLHNEEFNSFRFLDHSVGHFFELAKKEKYFDNTIFVLFGDHGDKGQAGTEQVNYYGNQSTPRFHVPLIFYAPKIIKPTQIDTVVSELDVFPTLASIVGLEHRNTGLGRNQLDEANRSESYAIMRSFGSTYGLIGDEFYYIINDRTKKEELFRYRSDTPGVDVSQEYPEKFQRMSELAKGLKESTLYLLNTNKKLKNN